MLVTQKKQIRKVQVTLQWVPGLITKHFGKFSENLLIKLPLNQVQIKEQFSLAKIR